MTIYQRISDGEFKHNELYTTIVTDRVQWEKYHEAERQSILNFRQALFDEHGVSNHPKRNKAFDIAWEHGHASGFTEVANYFADLAELLKE
jgi:hypothetical protein